MTIKEMNRIKDERGYSYDILSLYSGVPRATVVNVLTGVSAKPRPATLYALERVLAGSELEYPGKRYHYGLSKLDPEFNITGDESKTPVFRLAEEKNNYVAVPQKRGISAEDFLQMRLDYPAELINGKIFRRPEPNLVHSEICEYFYNEFRSYIEKKKGKCRPKISNTNVVLPPEDGMDSVVCPDFYVVCDESKFDWYGVDGAPDFVLEVVSKENWKNDYTTKVHKYEVSGVKEYWLLDPFRRQLLVFVYVSRDGEPVLPKMSPLTGKAGVYLYEDDLKIDLDVINGLIDRYGKKDVL